VITSANPRVGSLVTRHSHGLDQFCSSLEERPGLSILDLAGASQATISFLTKLRAPAVFGRFRPPDGPAFWRRRFLRRISPIRSRAESFCRPRSIFRKGHFDGVLVWDTLQFLSPPLLQIVVERLHRMLRPGSCLLAFFHAKSASTRFRPIPIACPTIARLRWRHAGAADPRSSSTIAALRNCFRIFNRSNFFLTRDHLREVIVRR